MKRFVTYLYEYERGVKTKNTGFIKVDIRGGMVNMEICIRKFLIGGETGTIFGLVPHKGLQGIELGDVKVYNGQGDWRLQFSENHLQDTDFSMDDLVGVGIRFRNQSYIASCWIDEYADVIGRGDFAEREEVLPVVKPEESVCETLVTQSLSDKQYLYRKIDLTHMREIPLQDRHYGSNAFVVHGFWNYGYLILKTEVEGDEKKTLLGVPGIYERPEATMALAFGFPKFETFPPEMEEEVFLTERSFSQEEVEQNQPPKEKTFGCWFVELHA